MKSDPAPGWVGALYGLGVAAFAVTVGHWWSVLAWLEDHEKLAAWVQAIGSIVVIWAGFSVARLQAAQQSRELRDSEHRRLAARLRAAAMVIKTTHTSSRAWIDRIRASKNREKEALATLEGTYDDFNIEALREINVAELEIPAAIDIVMTARAQLQLMRKRIQLLSEGDASMLDKAERAVPVFDRMFKRMVELTQSYERP